MKFFFEQVPLIDSRVSERDLQLNMRVNHHRKVCPFARLVGGKIWRARKLRSNDCTHTHTHIQTHSSSTSGAHNNDKIEEVTVARESCK